MTRALILLVACFVLNVLGSAQAPAPRANDSSETQYITAPDQPYGQAALSEGGWSSVSGILGSTTRTSPNPNAKRDGFADAARAAVLRPVRHFDLVLDVAPQLQAAKCDRAGSRATTIPPPSA